MTGLTLPSGGVLATTPPPRRYVVLGGRGFIGTRLVALLAETGVNVRSFGRLPPPAMPAAAAPGRANVEHMVGDATKPDDLRQALEGADICFLLLSSTIPQTSNEAPIVDATSAILGSLAVFEACRQAGVRKIVYLSSGGTVYGRAQYLPIDEGHPTDPLCAYGVSRLAVEKYLRLQNALYGMDYCILRASNIYGPGQRLEAAQGAVGVFMGRLLNGRPIELWGDGSVVRDYLYIDDLVRSLVAAAEPHGDRHLFNVGSGVGHSLNDLLEALQEVIGLAPATNRHPGRNFDVPANVLDIRAAAAGLGWTPQIDLTTGLRMTWQHLVAPPAQATGEQHRGK